MIIKVKAQSERSSAGPHHLVVLVKPNARKTEILEEKDNKLKIAVAAPAESGKANLELIKFLEKKFKGKAKIIRGKTSKRKIIKLG